MPQDKKNPEQIILECLEENTDKWLSGQELANRLQVTRNTVWRNINKLRDKGFQVNTSAGSGYQLARSKDELSAERIKIYLNRPENYHIEVFQSVHSTNKLLKEKARQGAKSGTVLVANSQLAGRGRLGRDFFSPADSGVYFSLLSRSETNLDFIRESPAIAAVSLAKALDDLLGSQTEIKWVNDIYVNGRKVSGILSEGEIDLEDNQMKYLVIGIGINVYQPAAEFPEEFRRRADFLVKDGKKFDLRNKIVANFLNNWEYYSAFKNHEQALQIFREKNYLQNKEVEVFVQGEAVRGKVLDINERFELLIKDKQQRTFAINHGEATLHQD